MNVTTKVIDGRVQVFVDGRPICDTNTSGPNGIKGPNGSLLYPSGVDRVSAALSSATTTTSSIMSSAESSVASCPRRHPYSPGDGASSIWQSFIELWKAIKEIRVEIRLSERFKAWLKEPVIKKKKP